jgi:hypothetical protein
MNISDRLRNHALWLDTGGKEGVKLDAHGENWRNRELFRVRLCFANLNRIDLRGSNLCLANLYRTNLENAKLNDVNLERATLVNSNLSGADLRGAKLSFIKGKNILFFALGGHTGQYVDGEIRIGCEVYTLEEWLDTYRKIGEKYSYSPDEIRRYGSILKSINFFSNIEERHHETY